MKKAIWEWLKKTWRWVRRGGRAARLLQRLENLLSRLRNALDAAKAIARRYEEAGEGAKAARAWTKAALLEQDIRRLEELRRKLSRGTASADEIRELERMLDRYGA